MPIQLAAEMLAAAERERFGWRADWSRCRRGGTTLVPPFRALLAYRAVQIMDERRMPGAIAEAGVWHGGMSCLMARAHRRRAASLGGPNRTSWLFDTFDGMPPPNRSLDGSKAAFLYGQYLNGTTTDSAAAWKRDGGATAHSMPSRAWWCVSPTSRTPCMCAARWRTR